MANTSENVTNINKQSFFEMQSFDSSRDYTFNDSFLKANLGMKKYKCDRCGKSFNNRVNLYSHVKTIHLKKKDYQCSECEQAYSMKSYLDRHIRSVH